MASPMVAFQANLSKGGEARHREISVVQNPPSISISNGSIAAAHPEIEKIKVKQDKLRSENVEVEKNVQINFNDENSRISNINNVVKVAGQTSFADEFSNKTENLENDFIKDAYNASVGGRYICPYCKLSCAKPSVLQKHIRAHTNERPYPCIPCGFAFKTKSNLYKHRRSRTHALRLQGADLSVTLNEDDLSGGSESDTSMPPTFISEAGSDASVHRIDNFDNNKSSPDSPDFLHEGLIQTLSSSMLSDTKSKSIYKPKFRAALYQESEDKDKLKKPISPNADFLTEHISKIISDNEAIVDVIETPLQKKYGKIKQIAESKQFSQEYIEIKSEPSPLNLTKNNYDLENSFRKRSHSESFSQNEYQKHPLNPEGSIIKDLLLKTKMNTLLSVTGELIEGPLFICPLCQIVYRSADNLETHRTYYCKGSVTNNAISVNAQKDIKLVRPEHVYVRSNSINVRLPETPSNSLMKSNISIKLSPPRVKPDNLIILKPDSNDIIAPLPSPGPLLGNTRLVDTRVPSEYNRINELKIKSLPSPKRKFDGKCDTYSARLGENVSPRPSETYSSQPKIRCIDGNSVVLRSMEDMSQQMRNNSTSLQMFGGEVKIVDHSGSTTTLRIEPNKNQLSPILIQNISPSKLASDTEASSVVVRSGLHSGGTIVHNPPTPKEIICTPQPQTPRIVTAPGIPTSNLPNIHDITHFQFPPLSAITAFNPLTLPPLSPSLSPNGATTILHGGKLIPHVPGMPGPNTPGILIGTSTSHPKKIANNDINKSPISREDLHGNIGQQTSKSALISKYETQQLRNTRSPNMRSSNIEHEKQLVNHEHLNFEGQHYISSVPVIKVKNMDEGSANVPKTFSHNIITSSLRQDGALKRNSEGVSRISILKENANYAQNKLKIRDKLSSNISLKTDEMKIEKDIRSFNFENLITKAEIYSNQIPNSSDVHKNMNAQDNIAVTETSERSETSYFQKNVMAKSANDDRKPKFLRPTTLPLKPGTFTPKRHHGITPNANTMPLVSPETPRPAKAYGQLYLNGNAYTYLGLKCSTKVFYCTINRPQPTYVPNQHFLSMYSNWQLLSELTPDPLGLSASSAMSLYDSRHRPQNVTVSMIKQDLLLTHSSQWNKITKENKQNIQPLDAKTSEENKLHISDHLNTPKKELTGGFESNEEYTYVRGRGRGRYVCSECGIRCKKPSMLKKHIRTHTDVRPYTCVHCAFSFKTKGNLTKHMKSKAHYKKCCELGINPTEGNDNENCENAQCSGETDDDTDSEGEEGNEGETESSDTEVCKSRLPEHEAARCLLSLGGSRPTSSAAPGLITSARPSTYPYTPTGLECISMEILPENLNISRSVSVDSRTETENEPIDLSKNEVKANNPITEIPTARESSVLASLASNTSKLPQHQAQWTNGEPMLHTYLTERALLDSRIKQSQLTCSMSKLKKQDLEKTAFVDNYNLGHNVRTVTSIKTSVVTSMITSQTVKEPKLINMVDNNQFKIASTTASVENFRIIKDTVVPTIHNLDTTKKIHIQTSTNAENAKHVVSEYLKHARINLIKTSEDNLQLQNDNGNDDNSNIKTNIEETSTTEDSNASETESIKLPSMEHDPVARKVVIGVGGVVKVTKMKDFDSSSYSPGRLMEDGRRVCDFCNKTFTKPSQLRLHLNIHYMERPFRCGVCAVSFRTRGHLQKHERSGSHHNKVSMTSTFGAATSFNPRPFRCSDCNIAFRIHGHLAKHLRSKMHVMRLECLFKLPFGTFTEIERAGVSLTDIDTTDCASSLASLQSLARKLHEKDPTKLEYRDAVDGGRGGAGAHSDGGDDEADADAFAFANDADVDADADADVASNAHIDASQVTSVDTSEGRDKETQVN